ncbi:hypothetical protein [Sinorhizobium meliloti]|uniref:Uncharacterized protein n=1 Tax=Sinorhizobium meliloti (strain SM11) TaxID=707241 RepID=F7X925_SINMM|nr:hypothetical protein [Sinorhizobium meliloti]AEH80284.1 hypothetical protein SM11_chr3041 [Sinorhizobium meliloti SM11]PII39517.1 hypothetical protein T190_03680 [Sinorhizobium meliloti CCBAU 01290]MDW9662342.1 hypothetical protein [Sinorhizobium meliloti]MQX03410.1 hypothetical protein [Sinorhizobium meliloti]MQX42335.1 hypothetical protein [Sinorhizobium meliloti]
MRHDRVSCYGMHFWMGVRIAIGSMPLGVTVSKRETSPKLDARGRQGPSPGA